MKHRQHTKLAKPYKRYYSQNEISILGSNCNRIQLLAQIIGNKLSDKYPVSYVDADHASSSKSKNTGAPAVFTKEFTNKISYHQFNTTGQVSDYEKDAFFNSSHLTLVNGNHEKAGCQIVIIDKKKEESLRRRKEALTRVIALVRIDDEDRELPSYIKELIPDHSEIPVISINDQVGLSDLVKAFLEGRTPEMNGLILGGGKSTRMGTDKAFLDYHGLPQHAYLENILSAFCTEVFVSCREDQESLFKKPITDSFLGLGAYSGLLSAFREDPNKAWFSVACDVPLLDKETLEKLVSNRNPAKIATCFYNSETAFPEPLITIWEPRAYPVLLHYMSMGYSCPRKVLINNDVEIVKLEDEDVLLNANTAEERERALNKLSDTTT